MIFGLIIVFCYLFPVILIVQIIAVMTKSLLHVRSSLILLNSSVTGQ